MNVVVLVYLCREHCSVVYMTLAFMAPRKFGDLIIISNLHNIIALLMRSFKKPAFQPHLHTCTRNKQLCVFFSQPFIHPVSSCLTVPCP